MVYPANDTRSSGVAGAQARTETAAARVGDTMQRAKEEITSTTASAREDIGENLRKLGDDVASLKDTVAQLTKSVASQVGAAASDIGTDLGAAAKEQASTLLTEFEKLARRNPVAVVAGALCVGMFIGLLRGRS